MPVDGARNPDISAISVDLPGAVRPEQAGDAGADGHRDVVDRDDVAVPPRDVVDLDRAHRFGSPRSGSAAASGRSRPASTVTTAATDVRARPWRRRSAVSACASGESKRKTCTPVDQGVRREQPGHLADRVVAGLVGDALDGRDHRVADQQHHDHRRHREPAADVSAATRAASPDRQAASSSAPTMRAEEAPGLAADAAGRRAARRRTSAAAARRSARTSRRSAMPAAPARRPSAASGGRGRA